MKPFFECLVKGARGDASLVRTELWKVKMDPADRDALAGELARPLGVTKEVLLGKGSKQEKEARAKIFFEPLEPWNAPVDGNQLLGNTSKFIESVLFMPHEHILISALWSFFTYIHSQSYVRVSTFLAFTSPTKEYGKSLALDVLALICFNGFPVGRITQSSFFRMIEQWKPTLFFEEFHLRAQTDPGLVADLIVSYTKDRRVIVTNTNTLEPEPFNIFCPKAFTYIGEMNDHLGARTIEMPMKKKPVDLIKTRLIEIDDEVTIELRRQFLRWAVDHAAAIGSCPSTRAGFPSNRTEDNWEILLKIARTIDPLNADAVISVAKNFEAKFPKPESVEESVVKGVRDVYVGFCERNNRNFNDPATDFFLSLVTICNGLNAVNDAPWGNWHWGDKHGIQPYKLSVILRAYTRLVPSKSRKDPLADDENVKGYWLKDLRETFTNICPDHP